ncbi:glycine cleavage system protein GcvH [Halopseudomonas pelagia]|jgi:glycine cleavage system H protein|uniref:Glycine cleavage system H protein n=1 Tax=Halopseudomonas pelagia TaxID=553151 RepID=A0AA91Z5L6_9GAMM|nr:glycine cleavage system protein GcvH [Halopseudomonas pelagia]MBQ0742489.1 glycine cleavage system protein GcvH [Pseudomonas sp.]WOD11924.1 glycine cleavage system protein GcvH [Pseudomonas sp. NyZ704]MBQ0777321.1 glycine cleavage system protein GcvH [Pseudomonas sp.]PCC98881.1 glycine cleavage system protein H [Halopseudomonas pelagia]QFY58289.1 glycine cleavage system protein GcvH [Halopseudomonas pelagia]|tara:strand:- start:449 stop:829 length:381 start_codon:yes stop_codon:yes gene_type:complete
MSNIPADLRYAASHEWTRQEADGTVTIGITDHAQDLLGDVVFVELPDVGRTVSAGEECAVVESVKAASDIYAPVSGEVVAVNEALADGPELVNSEPYEGAWFFKIKPSDTSELDKLMDADAYGASI